MQERLKGGIDCLSNHPKASSGFEWTIEVDPHMGIVDPHMGIHQVGYKFPLIYT